MQRRREREKERDEVHGRWRGGETGNRRGQGEARSSFSSAAAPKSSRAKKRNGRKTAFIKLSADARPLLRPFFARFSSPFHPPGTANSLLDSSTPRLPHLPARLFHVRNSWPLLLPWNEVGMCKIVPRYALHHRVASSRVALFPSLAFFRASLYLYPPRSSISFLDLHP